MILPTVFCALVTLPLVAQTTPQNPDDRLVASINGEVITAREFNHMWDRLTPEMRQSYEKAGGKLQFLDNYLRKRLVIQDAITTGFDKRPEVALELQAARESTLFDRYVRDVVANKVVSEADLQAYYKNNSHEFMRPEMIRVRHIIATPDANPVMNTTGDNARSEEEALEKIKRIAMMFRTVGGNFSEIAQQYSEDASARSGGDLGWFAFGKFVPEFEHAAFALKKPGETSGVVKTQFGYHVLRLEGRRASAPAPYEEVRQQIREKLVNERQAKIIEAVSKLTEELRASSKLEIYRENL